MTEIYAGNSKFTPHEFIKVTSAGVLSKRLGVRSAIKNTRIYLANTTGYVSIADIVPPLFCQIGDYQGLCYAYDLVSGGSPEAIDCPFRKEIISHANAYIAATERRVTEHIYSTFSEDAKYFRQWEVANAAFATLKELESDIYVCIRDTGDDSKRMQVASIGGLLYVNNRSASSNLSLRVVNYLRQDAVVFDLCATLAKLKDIPLLRTQREKFRHESLANGVVPDFDAISLLDVTARHAYVLEALTIDQPKEQ